MLFMRPKQITEVTTFPSIAVCIPKTSIGARATRQIHSQRKQVKNVRKCVYFKKWPIIFANAQVFPFIGHIQDSSLSASCILQVGLQPSQSDSNPFMFGCFPAQLQLFVTHTFRFAINIFEMFQR